MHVPTLPAAVPWQPWSQSLSKMIAETGSRRSSGLLPHKDGDPGLFRWTPDYPISPHVSKEVVSEPAAGRAKLPLSRTGDRLSQLLRRIPFSYGAHKNRAVRQDPRSP